MRRVISLMSGLSMVALGLGLTFSPASAEDSPEGHECHGEIVVQLEAWLWAQPGHDSYTFELPQPLGPGTWSVNTQSYDGYEGREHSSQDNERWNLRLLNDGVVVATVGPTTDIPDGIDHASSADELGTVNLDDGADSIVVVHSGESREGGTDSVHAACVGFDPVAPPASTTTSTTPPAVSTTTSTTPPASTTTTAPPASTIPVGPTTTFGPAAPTSSVPAGTTLDPPIAPAPAGPILSLSATVDCSARSVVADIDNAGDRATTVDVFLVADSVQTGVRVPPGGNTRVAFTLPGSAEGTTLELVISDTSGVVDTDSVQVDCATPASVAAATSVDCAAGTLVVGLVNEGQETASLSVIVEQSGLIDTINLEGGRSRRVVIDLEGRSAIPLRVVDSTGVDILRRTIAPDCPSPDLAVSTTVSCTTNEILITVQNRGDAPAEIQAGLGDGGVDGVVVDPSETVVIGLPYDPGSRSETLRLTGTDSLVAAGGEVLLGCEPRPEATPSPCSSIYLSDPSASTTTILATPPPGEPWWTAADTIPDLGSGNGIGASRSCAVPEVDFSPNCSIGTLTIRMSNTGSIPTRLVVLLDDDATGPAIDVGAGASMVTAMGISGAETVTVFEAGRVEPIASLRLSCDSGGKGLRTAAYAVFSLSVLTSILTASAGPRRLLMLFR